MNNKIVNSIKQASSTVFERTGKTTGRALHITGASCMGNMVVGVGKLIMGILSLSVFTCVSACYTFGMVTAKCAVLAGIVKEENKKGQYHYYKMAGTILIAASILYIIYSFRLLLNPTVSSYNQNVALAIATFTFTELTLNIRGVIVERHNHTPLIHAIKMINLASSLICLVLTQTAILAISSDHVETQSQSNGFFGILMGGAATLIGIIMLLQVKRFRKGKNYGAACYQVKKLMKREQIGIKIKPILYIENPESNDDLYIQIKEDHSEEQFSRLKIQAEEELHITLFDTDSSK